MRYLLVTTFITALLLASALFTRTYVEETGEASVRAITQRNLAANDIRQLRDAILATREHFDTFMWLPSELHRQAVIEAIDNVIKIQSRVLQSEWVIENEIYKTLDDFTYDTQSLSGSLKGVMERRVTPLAHPPIRDLLEGKLAPAERAVQEQLEQIGTDRTPPGELQRQLLALGIGWQQIVNDYHLTLALNHDDHQMMEPAREGAPQLRRYRELLAQLRSLNETAQLGLAPPALRQASRTLLEGAEAWLQAAEGMEPLDESRTIHTTILQLKQDVTPLFDHLWGYLIQLESLQSQSAQHDSELLKHVGDTVVSALWILGLIGFGFIIVGFVYFERGVLKPISMVASALRKESYGLSISELPSVQFRETRHLVDAFFEMRRQVEEREQALEYMALHDGLTELPNRHLFMQRVESAIQGSQGPGDKFAILIAGIDRFKSINDSLGHHIGDEILKIFSSRLHNNLDAATTLARLGSDEFAILLPDSSSERAAKVAKKLLSAFEAPLHIEGNKLYLSCSFGIVEYPAHGRSASELLRTAGIALYLAKRQQQDLVTYRHEHEEGGPDRLAIASELKEAIQQGELHLSYQPQFTVDEQRFVGMEVLARWEHHEHGTISPAVFIPLAEQTGLIHPLTDWMIAQTLSQCQRWLERGYDPGVVSINVSAFNIHDQDFIEKLKICTDRHGIKPQRILLELTETAMMADPAYALATLKELSELGFQLAIDDFGTGFSSLSYLKQLPVNKLKIDKSFVSSMIENENDAVIVRSTIDLAHNLGLQLVAEGVDHPEVLSLLDILDCDYAQGFLLSKPLTAEQLEAEFLAPPAAAPKLVLCSGSEPLA